MTSVINEDSKNKKFQDSHLTEVCITRPKVETKKKRKVSLKKKLKSIKSHQLTI